ncbi:hypothetical protein DL96DRAFT_962317 [Flagelloscypha sp. PMI_526]|nr:hypothetical protein DL96DRAFT_962317 [Flagelloscypha sp. PMI_526]
MPHRAPDTRLLTTLLTSTSTLQKALNQFHQSHLSHITCLTAYASSSSPPTSSVLLASSSLLSRCIEDGLVVKLDAALEAWTKALSTLKDVEKEVGRMGRDREILIGRVIKASQKMTGSGGKRDSTLGSAAGSASSSSLGTPPLTPTGLNGRLNQSQIELQACEAALIQKENELSTLRTTAVRV